MEPNEKYAYVEAQIPIDINSSGTSLAPLRILWLGSGTFTDRLGVYKNLLLLPGTGTKVIAIDLLKPDPKALSAAVAYAATDQGYQLRFEQGDAHQLRFQDGLFDTVVCCSMFLCQDFNPEMVVRKIKCVLNWRTFRLL